MGCPLSKAEEKLIASAMRGKPTWEETRKRYIVYPDSPAMLRIKKILAEAEAPMSGREIAGIVLAGLIASAFRNHFSWIKRIAP